MKPETKAAFEKLLSEPANKTCIDCDTYNPQWASVSNGVFMCIKCAGTHRSLGVHITFVRSVTMDSWSKIQLARMKCGGNAKLRKFIKTQKFPSNLSSKEKYDNEAMEKYRAYLLSMAKGENPDPIPFIGYKANIISPKKTSFNNNNNNNGNGIGGNNNNYGNYNASSSSSSLSSGGFGNYDPTEAEDNNLSDMFGGLSSWTSNIAAKTSVIAADFANKSKEAAVSISEKAATQANDIRSKVNDPDFHANFKNKANEGWASMSGWLSSATSQVSKQVTTLYNDTMGDDEPTSLYNENAIDRSKMKSDSKYTSDNAAFSSDQWFEKHPSKYAKNAISSDTYFNNNNNNNNNNNSNSNNSNYNNNNNNNRNNNRSSKKSILNSNNNRNERSNYGSNNRNNNNNNNNNVTIDDDDDDLQSPNSKENDENNTDDWGFGGNDDDNDNDNEVNSKKGNDNNEDLLNLNENMNKMSLSSKSQSNNNDNDDFEDILDLDNESNNDSTKNDKKDSKNTKNNDNDTNDDDWGW